MSAGTQWVLFGGLPGAPNDAVFRVLSADEVRSLLANPQEWGVSEFGTLQEMISQQRPDPDYWPDGYAVLARVRDIVPVLSTYQLPKGENLA